MGTDIHGYIDYPTGPKTATESYWHTVCEFPNNLDRCYSIFGFLAGVRGEAKAVVEPRGWPDNDNRGFVIDDEYDGYHTKSYVTMSEYAEVLRRYPDDSKEYLPRSCWALIAKIMCEYPGSRFLFGFDS